MGFLVGLVIGIVSIIGYRNTGSPTLFRLAIAFCSISAGFFVIWMGYMIEDFVIKSGHLERWIQTLGIAIQTVGYFFIAFSHSIKSLFPKSRYFRSVGILPCMRRIRKSYRRVFPGTRLSPVFALSRHRRNTCHPGKFIPEAPHRRLTRRKPGNESILVIARRPSA